MAEIWHRLDLDERPKRRPQPAGAERLDALTAEYDIELRPLLALRAMKTEWRELALRSIERNVFFEPDLLLPAAQHLPAAQAPAVLLVRRRRAPMGRLVGLVPLQSSRIPLLADRLKIYTTPYHPVGVPLIDAMEAPRVLAALLDWGAARRGSMTGLGGNLLGVAGLMFPRVPVDGAFARALRFAAKQTGRQIAELDRTMRPVLRAAPDGAVPHLTRKHRKELERCARRLAEHGPLRFEQATRDIALRSAMEGFLALEASSWKGERGTAMVQDARSSAFIRSATRALGAEAQCSVFSLYAGDALAAAAIMLRSGDSSWFYKIAYDARFAKASPGVLLTAELTRRQLMDRRTATTDSCADYRSGLLDMLWSQATPYADLVVSVRREGEAAAQVMLAREALRRSLRSNAKALWRRFKGYQR